jgi:hypothetical protein
MSKQLRVKPMVEAEVKSQSQNRKEDMRRKRRQCKDAALAALEDRKVAHRWKKMWHTRARKSGKESRGKLDQAECGTEPD